jgi:hypothetical protein
LQSSSSSMSSARWGQVGRQLGQVGAHHETVVLTSLMRVLVRQV